MYVALPSGTVLLLLCAHFVLEADLSRDAKRNILVNPLTLSNCTHVFGDRLFFLLLPGIDLEMPAFLAVEKGNRKTKAIKSDPNARGHVDYLTR